MYDIPKIGTYKVLKIQRLDRRNKVFNMIAVLNTQN